MATGAWDRTAAEGFWSMAAMATKEALAKLAGIQFNPYRKGGKRATWADVFGAGRAMLAEKKAREASANGKPEGV